MKSKLVVVVMLTLLLMSISTLMFRVQPVESSSEETVVLYILSEIVNSATSYNDSDPNFGIHYWSYETNITYSPPDANGVVNLTGHVHMLEPSYNPITNMTTLTVFMSDWHGKMYTANGTGDVDIISKTNDTGTFFWKDGAWYPAGDEWIGDGTLDPAGSAWYAGTHNTSVYLGNGTNGPLIGSYTHQIWLTTGYSENTIVEPNSRLNGFCVNATGKPFLSPYVGTVGTFVFTNSKLNIPWWGGMHLDEQGKTDQCVAEPPVFMTTLFSPANLYVTDPDNKHIGTNPATGGEVNEISGAFYSGPGTHPQRIVIQDPLDGVYDIKIVGTSTGEYTLVIELATEEKTTSCSYAGNISVGQILESQANISEGEMTSTEPVLTSPVGGISIPVNKLQLLAPYIGLTVLLAVAVITVVYVKKRKRHTEINS